MNKSENAVWFNPKFRRFEVVCHKTDLAVKYVVLNYCISGVDEKSVTQYTLGCSNATGEVKWFYPQELVIYDKNKALIEGSHYTEEEDG